MAVVPSSPFRFHPPFLCSADRSPCRSPVSDVASFSFSSLNRITELFFQALCTESEAVYSHVMERRLPEISGLLSLPLRIRLLASDDLAGLTRGSDRIFIHLLVDRIDECEKNRKIKWVPFSGSLLIADSSARSFNRDTRLPESW